MHCIINNKYTVIYCDRVKIIRSYFSGKFFGFHFLFQQVITHVFRQQVSFLFLQHCFGDLETDAKYLRLALFFGIFNMIWCNTSSCEGTWIWIFFALLLPLFELTPLTDCILEKTFFFEPEKLAHFDSNVDSLLRFQYPFRRPLYFPKLSVCTVLSWVFELVWSKK